MSKAFASGETQAADVVLPLPVGRRPITARGMAAAKRALRALTTDELLPQLALAGSEDADARGKLQAVQRRVRQMERQIELSDVVPEPRDPCVRVSIGTRVTVRNDDDENQLLVYALVGPDEVDLGRRRISQASPVAQALLGRTIGERTFFKRPAGTLAVVIERIDVDRD